MDRLLDKTAVRLYDMAAYANKQVFCRAAYGMAVITVIYNAKKIQTRRKVASV